MKTINAYVVVVRKQEMPDSQAVARIARVLQRGSPVIGKSSIFKVRCMIDLAKKRSAIIWFGVLRVLRGGMRCL